jgi:hypothetical protein
MRQHNSALKIRDRTVFYICDSCGIRGAYSERGERESLKMPYWKRVFGGDD